MDPTDLTPPAGPPAETFRPHERIRSADDFRRAFQRRKTAADGAMVVYAVENGRDHARLGLSVARKKIRRATGRNRTKRLIREAFRRSKSALPVGVDYVVVPRGFLDDAEAVRNSFVRLARDAARRLGSRPKPPPP